MSTQVEVLTVPVTDDGDHDRFAHYFERKDLDRCFFEGAEIVALCGKRDRPTRDFTKYPVCPDCKHLYENVVGKG